MTKIKLWYSCTKKRKTIMTAIGAILSFLSLSLRFQLKNDARNRNTQSEDMKYILIWTKGDTICPLEILGSGPDIFIKSNCSQKNCYITPNRDLFEGDLSSFHALTFNGDVVHLTKLQLPQNRFPHQKYIYYNQESSDLGPVSRKMFDGFFNWTSTYKLDSDMPYPYMTIRNNKGVIVGPRAKIKWKNEMYANESLLYKFRSKYKAAAWFVSHCTTKRRREIFVINLRKALKRYGQNVEVYGSCGRLKCPRDRHFTNCVHMLERDYFFYLSFENSFADDYVTEKLLIALQNDVVPIVYGGADYSRFLPPNSYLDARMHTPEVLAAKMYQLMQYPELYLQYFTWKQYYSYHTFTEGDALCELCSALNNETKLSFSVHTNFRKWWNSQNVTVN